MYTYVQVSPVNLYVSLPLDAGVELLLYSRPMFDPRSGSIITCLKLRSHRQPFLSPPRRLCFRRCLSVCLLATLRKNVRTDLHEIFREG